MSSHHFVKEGQEPALFIVNPVSVEFIGDLFEWAPLVLVLDTALDEVINWGVKIDIVLASEEHLNELNEKISNQFPVEVFSYRQTDDPVLIGLQILVGLKQRAVSILSVSEQTFSSAQNFSGLIQISIFSTVMKWAFLPDCKYEKWLPAQSKIAVRKTEPDQDVFAPQLKLYKSDCYETVQDTQLLLTSKKSFWVGEFLR
jgi:hypothetical protein